MAWKEKVERLRDKTPGGPDQLEAFCEVEVAHDERGWSLGWRDAIAGILSAYPALARLVARMNIRFVFTDLTAFRVVPGTDDECTAIHWALDDPNTNIRREWQYRRWAVIDAIGRAILRTATEAYQARYAKLFKDNGAITDNATAEDEHAYLFLLACAGPDEEIDEIERSHPDRMKPGEFSLRFGCLLDRVNDLGA